MTEVTQICVALENKPGMFARLCESLRRAGVEIKAMFVSDDVGCCWVNLVAEPTVTAERALVDDGYRLFTEKVLLLEVRDQVAGLEFIARNLADAGINIDYVYGSAGIGSSFNLVLKVSEPAAAMELLGDTKSGAVRVA